MRLIACIWVARTSERRTLSKQNGCINCRFAFKASYVSACHLPWLLLLFLLNVYWIWNVWTTLFITSSKMVLIIDYQTINSKLCHKSATENSIFHNYAFCRGLVGWGSWLEKMLFIASFTLHIHLHTLFSLNYLYIFYSSPKTTTQEERYQQNVSSHILITTVSKFLMPKCSEFTDCMKNLTNFSKGMERAERLENMPHAFP